MKAISPLSGTMARYNSMQAYHGEDTVVCYSEEDIFRLFGIDYKTPEQRDI